MSRKGARTAVVAGMICLVCAGADSLLADQSALGREEPADASTSSRDWIGAMLTSGEPGMCHLKTPIYHWRNVGWGSNINQILKRWVGSIIEGRQDCSLDVTQDFIQQIRCPGDPTGPTRDVTGWHCMFKPMPRLCTFQDSSVLEDQRKAMRNPSASPAVKNPLPKPHDTTVVASAVLDFMYSHAQPWFQHDFEAVLLEENISLLRQGQFVAIHVRRGDKLRREASKVEVWVYLEAAALHAWESSGDRSGVDSISGIWVSSDDSSVLAEVQELAPVYFPNVKKDKIMTISFRDIGPDHPNDKSDELTTKAHEMTYELYVGLHAELKMMAEARVFVGTFSSNIARLVYVMRESNGLPRDSTVSVDEPDWGLH